MKHYGEDLISPEALQESISALDKELDQKVGEVLIFAKRVDHSTAESLDAMSKRIQSLQTTVMALTFALVVSIGAIICLFVK